MKRMWREAGTKMSALMNSNPLLRSVLTMMSGTALAQLIAIILTIFIARIYTDSERGLYAIFISVTGIAAVIASLRYDLAIVLPKNDAVARVLNRIATRSIVVVAMLTSLTCIALSSVIIDLYGSVELSRWLWASGISVFAVAELANIQFWLTRKARFGDIAVNRIYQSAGVAGSQLLAGIIMGGGLSALLIGTMVGQVFALAVMGSRVPELREPMPPDAPTVLSTMSRFRRMPLLNGPNAVVDAIRTNGISIIIGMYAVAALGQFNMAWTVMQVPVGLITGSVAQVFLKKLADTPPGQMRRLMSFTITRAAIAAVLPFAVIYALAPLLFPIVFGSQWDQVGDFARALTPWLFLMVLTSPISHIFVVTGTQGRMLVFAIAYCIAPLAWLVLSPLSLLSTIWVLGALMAVMLVGLLGLAWWTAGQYDSGDGMVKSWKVGDDE